MRHQGARVPSGDYFDDLFEDNNPNAVGVFQGMGMNEHERVSQQISENGVELKMSCRYCGRDSIVTVEWEELYYVALNGPGKPVVLPQGWFRSDNNHDCYTLVPCYRSHEHRNEGFAPHFTPDEARGLLKQAVDSGFVTQSQVMQWQQKAAMYRGAAPR